GGWTLCSSGGEIWTAVKPAGPRTCSHSVATSVHFHSNRWTNTSPAAMWPLGRYVGESVGRGGGGFPVIRGAVYPPEQAAAPVRIAASAPRPRRRSDGAVVKSQAVARSAIDPGNRDSASDLDWRSVRSPESDRDSGASRSRRRWNPCRRHSRLSKP